MVNNKTRKVRNFDKIQHHHFLLRMEMKSCPSDADKKQAGELLQKIIRDIRMKPLDTPRIYYVKKPYYNEGLTAIMPIQTSHIAFHFWKNPDALILKSSESKCLLEFDIYTCGSLNTRQIQKVLHHLTYYHPTRVDATILNRKWSLAIEKHWHWSADDGTSWIDWIESMN
jgi:S-adenosylmethionine/arginine decarboxylase-like enzyme